MIDVSAMFSGITALLEDMHSVSVGGQAKDLTSDEGVVFVGILRAGIARLERQVTDASKALSR